MPLIVPSQAMASETWLTISMPTRVLAGTYAPVALTDLGFKSGYCVFGIGNYPQYPGKFEDPGIFRVVKGKAKTKLLATNPGAAHISFVCSTKSHPSPSDAPHATSALDLYIAP